MNAHPDRRTFLRSIAAGVLAAGATRSFCQPLWEQAASGVAPISLDPLPENEAHLPQIKSEPWLRVDPGNVVLKGMAFDRQDNLFVIASYPGANDKGLAGRLDRSILRITPKKEVTTVYKEHGVRMCDHAIHKDGRIFVACLTGELLVMQPDGSEVKAISSRWNSKPEELSDLTFDKHGALYVTDFTGKPGNPAGGVYRWSPDFTMVEPFGPKLVSPNGIAFTRDESSLWVSCSFDKKLVQLNLSRDRMSVTGIGASYALSGAGGDGIRVDKKDNVYLAMNFQGRSMIFNAKGEPVANVLLPGRERGELLASPNLAFRPGTDEVYAVASGDVGGTWIYRFRGLAEGLPLYSHQ
jgi:lactonase